MDYSELVLSHLQSLSLEDTPKKTYFLIKYEKRFNNSAVKESSETFEILDIFNDFKCAYDAMELILKSNKFDFFGLLTKYYRLYTDNDYDDNIIQKTVDCLVGFMSYNSRFNIGNEFTIDETHITATKNCNFITITEKRKNILNVNSLIITDSKINISYL